VVHTRLSVGGGVDAGALALAEVVVLLEGVELPLDELVLELVAVSGNHGSSPVHIVAESSQVLHAHGREVLEPLVAVGEGVDLVLGDAHLENVILPLDFGFFLLGVFLQSFRGNSLHVVGCISELSEFQRQPVTRCIDRGAGAVEAEGPEHILALQALEPSRKFVLTCTESVAQMQLSIHVGLRKCHHLFRSRVRVRFVCAVFFPKILSCDFYAL